jgi:hypothetical protein
MYFAHAFGAGRLCSERGFSKGMHFFTQKQIKAYSSWVFVYVSLKYL